MRTIFSRRVLITLISGLLTLAVVAAVMLSLNQRQTQRGVRGAATPTQTSITYTVYSTPTSSAPASATPTAGSHATATPVSAPGSSVSPGNGATTPTPTKGRVPGSSLNASATPTPAPTSTPGGSSSTGTPTTSPTSTATTSASPTATTAAPTATVAPPTPTSTPSLVDDSIVTGTFTTMTLNQNGGWITLPITMQNTGTSTWVNDWSYYIWCVSNCLYGDRVIAGPTVPGASASFEVTVDPPSVWTTNTYYTKWSMFHSGTPFGAIATIKLVVTAAVPLGVDPAPGCDTSNMSWSLSGGATCANGGLSLTSNSAQEPQATLVSAPSGFNASNYYITLHANFSNATGAWVRVVSYSSSGSTCNGQGLDVQPSGTFRPFSIVNCVESDGAWYTTSVLAGSPVTVTLWIKSGTWVVFINYALLESGSSPFTSGYPAITTGGNSGATVTVTNVELDTPVTPTTQGTLL